MSNEVVPQLIRKPRRRINLPTFAGRVRRARVPGSGLSAVSFVIPRQRRSSVPHALPPVRSRYARAHLPPAAPQPVPTYRHRKGNRCPLPPFAGHVRRGRVPGPTPTPVPTFLVFVRHRTAHVAPPVPPGRGHVRRRRVPGSGLSAISFVVPRHRMSHRAPSLPPERGHVRRRRVPYLAYNPTAFIVPRHRVSHTARPLQPFSGRHRRGLLIGTGVSEANVFVGRRRKSNAAQRQPVARGVGRHARVPGTGLTWIPFAFKRRRLLPWINPDWFKGIGKRRGVPSLGRGSPAGGPYIVVAGQLFVAGAVAAEISGE